MVGTRAQTHMYAHTYTHMYFIYGNQSWDVKTANRRCSSQWIQSWDVSFLSHSVAATDMHRTKANPADSWIWEKGRPRRLTEKRPPSVHEKIGLCWCAALSPKLRLLLHQLRSELPRQLKITTLTKEKWHLYYGHYSVANRAKKHNKMNPQSYSMSWSCPYRKYPEIPH